MDTLFQDFRFGIRMLYKNPGSTVIAVIALVLGIGLTTMMFSIVYGAILRGLPFEDQHELLHLETSIVEQDITSREVDPHDFAAWREQQRVFTDLAAWYSGTVNVSDGEQPERFDGAFITPNVFGMLRVGPAAGRLLQAEDDRVGAPYVMLISYEVWRDRFDLDPAAIGKVVRANGRPTTIVGVMPEKFAFPFSQAVWLPLQSNPQASPRGEAQSLEVMGRLRPGRTIDDAQLEMSRITKQLAAAFPATNEGMDAVVKPYTKEYIGPEESALLFTMLGAVVMVLLIACANVANLLIARAARRTREVGIRSAMGASKVRIIRQFLTESLALAAAGTVGGLLVAWAGIRIFNRAIVSTEPPFWIDIKLDGGVLLFVLATTLLAAFASGAIPAWQAARANVGDILKDEARGSSSFRLGRASRVLVIAEIALSVGLLIGAGLMIKSVTKIRTIDMGFQTAGLFTARIGLPGESYPDTASRARFFEQALARIAAQPGVASASLSSGMPAVGTGNWRFQVEGVTYENERGMPYGAYVTTSPQYFDVLGVAPVKGRALQDQDRAGALPVLVVSESVERLYLGGDALGKRIRLEGEAEPWRTVVGVVPDMYVAGLDEELQNGLYAPVAQADARFLTVMARTRGEPMSITGAVRAAVVAVDPDIPIYFARTYEEALDENYWFYGVFGSLFIAFGAAALFLAGIGLYGVMSTSVSHRTREMGVRMALGARAADVLGLVARQGMMQLAIGLAFGLVFAFFLSRFLTMLLFDVQPRDPLVWLATAAVLTGAAALATFVPARRATRVDPVHALRYD